MTPTMFFASVITFIGAFQIFDPMQIITQGGSERLDLTTVMYLYQTGFQALPDRLRLDDLALVFRGHHARHPAAVLGLTEVGAQRMTAASHRPAHRRFRRAPATRPSGSDG